MIPTHDLRTSSWHQVIINISICVMTTSKSLVSHTITTSSHHHGTRRPLSEDLVWTLSRGALEARKDNHFKINTSPGIRWWWLDRGEMPSIATIGAWSRGSALICFRPLGEPRVKWLGKTAGWTRPGLTFWDVNISFNYETSYYSMSRGDGGVVIGGVPSNKA